MRNSAAIFAFSINTIENEKRVGASEKKVCEF